MSLNLLAMNFWKRLQKKQDFPKYLTKVNDLEFKKFKENFKSHSNIHDVMKKLYHGEIFLIRNTIDKKYIEKLKKQIVILGKKEKSSFHKMIEGCPNFNRKINENNSKFYSLSSFRHVFYFFRWNKDKYKLFKKLDKIWDLIKYLNGYKYDAFKKNTPKNGIVDRIQVTRYPNNSGYIEAHQHHPGNIRIILNVYLSKKGKDFDSGGVFFYEKDKKVEVEKNFKVNIGDTLIFFSTLKHSVDTIKVTKKNRFSRNPLMQGRWWIGLYSPESDLVKNRKTSNPTNF